MNFAAAQADLTTTHDEMARHREGAKRDPLTGLANRGGLDFAFSRLLDARGGGNFGLRQLAPGRKKQPEKARAELARVVCRQPPRLNAGGSLVLPPWGSPAEKWPDAIKDLDTALTAYNRGPGQVDAALSHGMSANNGYAPKVLATYERLKQLNVANSPR